MTLDDAMQGHEVTYAEAEREIRRHGCTARLNADGSMSCHEGDTEYALKIGRWDRVALRSDAILAWLGY